MTPPRLRYALGLVQGLDLLLVAYQVIERTEQQRDVGPRCRQERHVPRVALHHIGRRFTLQEHLYVATHQLHGLHLIALGHEGGCVAARSGANVEHTRARLQKTVQMVQRGFKLNNAMTAQQALVLGMFVIMLLYVG